MRRAFGAGRTASVRSAASLAHGRGALLAAAQVVAAIGWLASAAAATPTGRPDAGPTATFTSSAQAVPSGAATPAPRTAGSPSRGAVAAAEPSGSGGTAAATPTARPTARPTATPTYSVLYEARIVPTEKAAHVTIQLEDPAGLVKQISFRVDPERHLDFAGDGKIEAAGDRVTWQPPARGGRLRYRFRIDHLRNERSYDARIRDSWAIFRGDDLVPPARVRARAGARAEARLRLRLPDGWTAVTPFPRSDDGTYEIEDPDRRFDRPVGWIAMGNLGVVRETVADTRVAIAGPRGQNLRRQDLLALLRWTLPTLRDVFPSLPPRLVIVGAGDPMWRGGLAAPRSLFVHAGRPAISEDGTSPLLHELVHVALGAPSGPGGDWVAEGLAELYSLEVLLRSGTLGRRRYERALERLESEGRRAGSLRVDPAGPEERARAVVVLRELDARLDETTAGRVRLDDVVRELARGGRPITTEGLREAAERLSETSLEAFFARPELTAPGAPTAS